MATEKFPLSAGALLAKEQRNVNRLIRAAYGVGATHRWFRKLPREAQESKVREWVNECIEARAERLARAGHA